MNKGNLKAREQILEEMAVLEEKLRAEDERLRRNNICSNCGSILNKVKLNDFRNQRFDEFRDVLKCTECNYIFRID